MSAAATKKPPHRVTVRDAARQLGICRDTFYVQQWHLTFTDYTSGRQRRVCAMELAVAAEHMRGADGLARAKAAVLALRADLGVLDPVGKAGRAG